MRESPRVPRSGTQPRATLVLVAEGDPTLLEIHSSALASSGFLVLGAGEGAEVVASAQRFHAHAVVLDLALPGPPPLEVARALRACDGTRRVGIVALAASRRLEEQAYAAGCDVFMTTPVLPEALVGEIVRLIAKRGRDASRPDHGSIVPK
jgi:CheY-like chemotaxis protein